MIDLDKSRAARREAKGEGPVVTLEGKEYKLPVELPFEALEALRGMNDPSTAAGSLVDFTEAMLGKSYAGMKGKLSFDDLESLVEGVLEEYGISSPLDSSAS